METQAIGRVRRYGQQLEIHVHRLLAEDTIDMTMFDGRSRELLSKADNVEVAQGPYQPIHKKKGGRPSSLEVEFSLKSPKQGGLQDRSGEGIEIDWMEVFVARIDTLQKGQLA